MRTIRFSLALVAAVVAIVIAVHILRRDTARDETPSPPGTTEPRVANAQAVESHLPETDATSEWGPLGPSWPFMDLRTSLIEDSAVEEVKPAVTGIVRRADTGAPVEGAIVFCTSHDIGVRTGGDGRYCLSDVGIGSHELVAYAPGLATAESAALILRARITLKLDLVLEPSKGLEGQVVDVETGAPVAGAIAMAAPYDEGHAPDLMGIVPESVLADAESKPEQLVMYCRDHPFLALTDVDGRFAMPVVPRAPAVLVVRARDHLVNRVGLNAAELKAPLRVELGWGRVIAGRVLSSDGEPIAGATVTCRTASANDFPGSNRAPIWLGGDRAVTETDQAGRFSFSGLAPNVYRLGVEHAEYAGVRVSSLDLETDEKIADVTVRLEPGGWIAGRVANDRGAPVRNESVEFTKPSARDDAQSADDGDYDEDYDAFFFMDKEELPRRWATTGQDGTYTSPPLAPGDYIVALHAPWLEHGPSRTVTVTAGHTVVDVDLVTPTGSGITGRVVDQDGAPVEAATILVTRGRRLEGRACTEADGAFVFADLEAGDHDIRVHAAGFPRYQRAHTVPASDVEIVLSRGGRISGCVIDTNTQKPVEKYDVWTHTDADRGNTFESGSVERLTTEDWDGDLHPEGRFDETGLSPGRYSVVVSSGPYKTAIVGDVRVEDGRDPEDLLIELVPATTVTLRVVSAADGTSVEDAIVTAKPRAASSLFPYGGTEDRFGYATPTTGPDGACTLLGMVAGRHELVVSHQAYAPKTVRFDIAEGELRREIDVALDEGLTLRGRVVAKPDGVPVEGATVFLDADDSVRLTYDESRGPSAETDEDGGFTLERIIPGAYTLCADHDAHGPYRADIDLTVAPLADVLIELGAGGRVIGTVKTVDGLLAQGVAIRVTNLARPHADADETLTDPTGAYKIAHLAPGPYAVELSRPHGGNVVDSVFVADEYHGGTREALRAVVTEGEAARVDFVVGGGAAVYGAITLDGEPVDTAAVDLRPANHLCTPVEGTWGWTGRCDLEGEYRFEGLKPGRYALSVFFLDRQSDSLRRSQKEFEIGTEGVRLDFEFDACLVSGKILDSAGNPIVQAGVALLPDSGTTKRTAALHAATRMSGFTRADENGAFQFSNIEPGTYRLVATADGYAPSFQSIEKLPDRDVESLVASLEKECVITGRIVTPNGTSPAGIVLTIMDADGRAWSGNNVHVNPHTGEFSIKGLAPGRFTMVANAKGYAPARENVFVTSRDQTSTVEFHLTKGRALTVSTVDASGSPVFGATAFVDDGGDPLITAYSVLRMAEWYPEHLVAGTDENGILVLPHLPDGAYTVHVQCDGHEDASVPVSIAGQDAEVTVTLKPWSE
ncbi:MAG: carboxypeptidase regulatory-like domain-containing protein [Verrucomicrobia bacterium]|nr:carboxypeptidase regulatory-like domain-containing protein [Verrucomicrobiota bacterium]